jgi:L-iditol 2-dehydrogenase
MRTLSFNGPDDVRLVDGPKPEPADGQALVRIEVSAICGSELHGEPGPTNPGHEAAGIVEIAPEGSGFDAGERVGISAVTGCGTCEHCRRGVQLYCSNGWRIHVGMHADLVAVPVSALRRLPAGTPPRDAVLITGDTLGVPVRAHRKVPSAPGGRLLIIGLGPIGLGHTLVRAHSGAHVVAVEPSEYRRELALELGAAEVLEPGQDIGPAPSLVIECTGLPACIQLALASVDLGGTVLQSGECAAVEISPSDTFIRREITYTGAWYYADEDFPEMVRLYEAGLPVGRLATDELPAEDAAEAYRRFVSKRSGKVILRWT